MLSSSITQSVNSAQTISPIKLNVRRPALLPPPSPIFAEFLKRARNLEPVNRPVGAHLQAFSTARTVQSNPPAGLYRIPRGGADVGLRRGNEIRFDELIERTSANFGLPSSLVKAVVRAESGFDAKAVSPMGASGLMQLMPGTARSLGVDDPFDPEQNINAGVEYLSRQLDRFGSVALALAAYNAGPNSVVEYGGIPPYRETQEYVSRVLEFQREIATDSELP